MWLTVRKSGRKSPVHKPTAIYLGNNFQFETLNERRRVTGCHADSLLLCETPISVQLLQSGHLPEKLVQQLYEQVPALKGALLVFQLEVF